MPSILMSEKLAGPPVAEASGTDTIATGELRRYARLLAALVLLVAIVALCSLTASAFLTTANINALVYQASITGIVAVCATSLTLSGNFFSIALGQTAVLCEVMFAIVLHDGYGVLPAILVALGIAVGLGLVQGGVVAFGANPLVTTLGASAALSGLAGLASGPTAISIPANSIVTWLGSAQPLGVPSETWAFIVVLVIMSVVVHGTRLGRAIRLSGSNRAAAVASGVPVRRVAITVFVLASVGAAITGIFGASLFHLASLSDFSNLDFNVVAAVLVGGTAVNGGIGSPLRSALAAVGIAVVSNYLLLRGWSVGTRDGLLGVVVIVAVVGFHLYYRRTKGAR
jgi:ribose transport system permease protein